MSTKSNPFAGCAPLISTIAPGQIGKISSGES
jgi:hypothetical protein